MVSVYLKKRFYIWSDAAAFMNEVRSEGGEAFITRDSNDMFVVNYTVQR